MAIQSGFSSKTICSFENRPIGCVYKIVTKYTSKDEIELAVRKAFQEVLIVALSFGFGLAVLVGELIGVLLVSHSVGYGREWHNNKQTHIKEKEIRFYR